MSVFKSWYKDYLIEKYTRCSNFPDLIPPSPELSYIIGVRYGDLGLRAAKLDLEVTDQDFAEEFTRCAGVVMGRAYTSKPRLDKNSFRVLVCSRILCDFLRLPLEDHKRWVEPSYSADFIRGLFDSEGGGYLSHGSDPCIIVYSTNKEVLHYSNLLLERHFGIKSIVNTPVSSIERIGETTFIRGRSTVMTKVVHRLYIVGLDEIEKFYWDINFSISRKSEILERGLYEIPHPIWEGRKGR